MDINYRISDKKNIYYKFHNMIISLGIVFLPIMSSVGTNSGGNIIGGVGRDASSYPFLLGVFIWLIVGTLKKNIIIPSNAISYALLFFLGSVLVSGVINFENIVLENRTSQNALNRLIEQSGSLFFYYMVSIYIYNFLYIYKLDAASYIEKRIVGSFVLAGGYSIIEILSYTGKPFIDVLIFVDTVIRGGYSYYDFRLRSLADEASLFGTYLSVIYPFIFVKSLESKKYICVFVYMVMIAGLSFSRTAYGIIIFETVLLILLFRTNIICKIKRITISIMVVFILFIGGSTYMENTYNINVIDPIQVINSFGSDSEKNEMSNITRFGSQVAAFNIFCDNPFVGVGWGQGTFYLNDYYPSWAKDSWEVAIKFRDHPIIFGLYPRILAELGLVGIISWIVIWILVINKLFKFNEKVFSIMMLGVLLSGFNMDIVRFYIYWIMLGMVWYISDNNIEG